VEKDRSLDNLRERNSDLQSNLGEVRRERDEIESRFDATEATLKGARKETAALNDRAGSLNEHVAKLGGQVADLTEERGTLQSSLSAAKAELQAAEAGAEAAKTEHRGALDGLGGDLADEQSKVAVLRVSLLSKTAALSKLQEKHESASALLTTSAKKYKQSENDHAAAEAVSAGKMSGLETEVAALAAKLETLAGKNAALDAAVQEQQAALDHAAQTASQSSAELSDTIAALEQKLADADAASKSGQRALEKIQTELIAKAAELGDVTLLEKRLAGMGGQLAANAEESESMITSLREQLAALEGSIKGMKETNASTDFEMAKKVKYLEMCVAEGEAGLEAAEEAEEEFKTELALKDATIKTLEEKVVVMQGLEEEYTAEVELLKSDLGNYKAALQDKVDEKAKIWEKADALEATLDDTIQKTFSLMWSSTEETNCIRCQSEFGVFKRKHKCGVCQRGFCYSCAGYSATIAGVRYRMCEGCHNSTIRS